MHWGVAGLRDTLMKGLRLCINIVAPYSRTDLKQECSKVRATERIHAALFLGYR